VNQTYLGYLLAAIVGYLLGSCPNGLIVSKSHGIDVRNFGSGNIGATNVLRVLGRKWGYLVFALDSLKGLLSVLFAYWISRRLLLDHASETLAAIIAGVACILGHSFPVWLRFKGGKGVATSAGVLLGLMPWAVVSVFIVWLLLFKTTRYVSLASIGAAVALPVLVMAYLHFRPEAEMSLLIFSLVIAAVVVWRHRSNIRRLLQGKEQRFGQQEL
jgi:acyl phosphate:glycerol-3-phosphate acyltransferase